MILPMTQHTHNAVWKKNYDYAHSNLYRLSASKQTMHSLAKQKESIEIGLHNQNAGKKI